MIENAIYFVDQINSSKANKMTALYHYSGTGFKKAKINLGIFRKSDSLMVGVLQWGCSFQNGIRLDKYVKEPIDKEQYLELNRFCMADSEGENAESQAISLGIKWIKKNLPNIKLLVSYAGRKEGNYGYIYQATNWEYLGYFISPGFWEINGEEKHMITLWSRYSSSGSLANNLQEFLCENYDDVKQTWSKQFIYIQRLDKKLTPAVEPKEYPKERNEYPIVTKEKIYKESGNTYTKKPRQYVEYYYVKDELLFTRRTLIKQGQRTTKIVIMYNSRGEFEKSFKTVAEIDRIDGFSTSGITKALKEGTIYKDKYFRYCPANEEIPEEIEIPYLCLIDEIPFATMAEMSRYLKVSRQAVSQAYKEKRTLIGNKSVLWHDD